MYKPVSYAEFFFKEHVSVDNSVTAKLKCGGIVIAEGTLTARTFNSDGIATVTFDKPLELDNDKLYEIMLPDNCIHSINNPEMTSHDISVAFNVPKYMQFSYTMIDSSQKNDDGTYKQYPMVSENYFYFCFPTEIEQSDNATMTLLREDTPIMQIPVITNYDSDLGLAWGHFDRKLNFEKDVHYSFILPEGSVMSIYRDDIVNAECRKDFIGAYEQKFAPIEYDSYDIDGQEHISEIRNVNIIYNTPIALAPGAKLQLLSSYGTVLEEANATLYNENDKYRLTANFDGYQLHESGSYAICIPEATVVGTGNDITVNKQNMIPINRQGLHVDDASTNKPFVSISGNKLHISNIAIGAHVSIYHTNGSTVYSSKANTHDITTYLPQNGTYVIRIAYDSATSYSATPPTTITITTKSSGAEL